MLRTQRNRETVFESFWASSLLQILITCNRRYVSSPSSLSLSTHFSLVYWPVGAVAYRLIIKLKITKPKAWSVAETRTSELTSLTTTHLSSPPSIHPMRRFNVSIFLHFYHERRLSSRSIGNVSLGVFSSILSISSIIYDNCCEIPNRAIAQQGVTSTHPKQGKYLHTHYPYLSLALVNSFKWIARKYCETNK